MLGALLSAEGYEVREAGDGGTALTLASDDPDVVLLDLMMPGLDGLATLERLRQQYPDLPVIMMSGRAGLADAVRATKLGALNFLEKPLSPEGVLLSTAAAAELRRSRRAARALREELGLGGTMVGESPAMQSVRALIARVAPTDARVLITGESGTGKELVAAAIHDASPRREKPFVRVNCAAIPRDLIESEMFGHERGAFTGATQTRIGRFELAHGGTLFLDEVGDLSAEAQAKLLRAIEGGEIQRVGGNRSTRVDVRIVAATNHDLARAVGDGGFREDLYFRLNVVPIAIPPLRERREDIVPLVEHIVARLHRATGRVTGGLTPEAVEEFVRYSWPGNVRELANLVERLLILHPNEEVGRAQVREVLSPAKNDGVETSAELGLNEALDAYERRLITQALALAEGNVADTARRLHTDRPNLYRRMKRLGIAVALVCAIGAPVRLNAVEQVVGSGAPEGWLTADSSRADSARADSAAVLLVTEGVRRSRLALTSGKTYNRVEGLPLRIGPVFTDSLGRTVLSIAAMGVMRSANEFHWDGQTVGHDATIDLRTRTTRGIGLSLTTYDLVAPVETWQMPADETGLAAFLFHRDYRDYYGRHGASGTVRLFAGVRTTLAFSLSSERWASREVRRVLTVLRNNHAWRDNPAADEGHMHLFVASAEVDTRNDVGTPWAGWHTLLEYERGSGAIDRFAALSPTARVESGKNITYGRAVVDVRRYNRISPQAQLNVRVIIGGWLHSGELPAQRRFSVGGPATVPGSDFRDATISPDVGTCSDGATPAGAPAQCERFALAQVEYRSELPFRAGTIFGGTPIRIRSAALTLRPTLVAFVDAGRGWLLPPRTGGATPVASAARDLVYRAGVIPPLSSFQTDVGLGVDLGLLGIYVAKSVSEMSEPANVFLRVRSRF